MNKYYKVKYSRDCRGFEIVKARSKKSAIKKVLRQFKINGLSLHKIDGIYSVEEINYFECLEEKK